MISTQIVLKKITTSTEKAPFKGPDIGFLHQYAEPKDKKHTLCIDDFIIDPYSVNLLMMGKKGQRYVINDFYEERTGLVYRYFTPSVIPGDEKSELLIKLAGFDEKDVCEGTLSTVGSGIVHERAKDIIYERNKFTQDTTHSHIMSRYMMGGSTINYDLFIGRSTNNWGMFALRDLSCYAFYFYKLTDFNASFTTIARYQLARSIPWGVIELGLIRTLWALQKAGAKIEDEATIMENSIAECYPTVLEMKEDIPALFEDRTKLAKFLMHTVYCCSGLIDEGVPKLNPEDILLNTLTTAHQYKIDLNVNLIPETFDKKASKGATALLHAVKNFESKIPIDALLKAGADIKAIDDEGNTVLHYAAYNKKVSLMEFFIKKDIDLAQKNKAGNTALHIAIENNNLTALIACIQHKTFYEALFERNFQKISPIKLIANAKNTDLMIKIIEHADEENLSYLLDAIPEEMTAGVKLIEDNLEKLQKRRPMV